MRRVLGLAILMMLIVPTIGNATCTFVSASNIPFGTYLPAANSTSTGTLTINRTASSASCSYSISLSTGSSGTYVPRYLKNGSSNLSYQLYTDAAYSTVWGNDTRVFFGNTGSNIYTVYARILSGQFPAPGTYTDAISASVTGQFTGTKTFNVTATVQATCTISATNLAFGNYAGTQLDASANITVNCTNTTPYNVGLDAGTATGATVNARKMKSGANLLNYALFSNSGRTTNWGSISAEGVPGTGNGSNQQITVYGRVAAGQSVTPGSYADTVIVTLTY